jgi:hypothetical protein
VTIFSYVVEHDYGREPNPYDGICTLCRCKFGKTLEKTRGIRGHKNIVELAKKDDWIIGTGGANLKRSAGHGNLVYAMRVHETPTGAECVADKRLKNRMPDVLLSPYQKNKQFALISKYFYYFGSRPFKNKDLDIRRFNLGANPRGFHHVHPEDFSKFLKWLERNFQPGIHGEPRSNSAKELKGCKECRSSC